MAEKKNESLSTAPKEERTSERYKWQRENNQARLKAYRDAGYRAKDGDFVLSSPSGGRSNVRLDGSLITSDKDKELWQRMNTKAKAGVPLDSTNGGESWSGENQASGTQGNKGATGGTPSQGAINNGGQTAGSTVAQNSQSNAQNQNGTGYDGTDGKGNITVGPQNANLNYYQYGDDSNPNQQGQKGGMNAKYTGEGVSNSYIEYNPDITLADLDPNYLYGENARQQNRKEAGYIARRNDMIASALYNEGKVSREDVANFLSQQNEWMNSTEADRLNTIESVWKRLGQIKPEEYQPDLSKAEDIVKDTSGKIYGKTTAEEGNPKQGIDTLADDNSVFTAMEESRVKSVQELVSLNPSDYVELELSGGLGFSEQTIRDAKKYFPDYFAEVEKEKKRRMTQQNVNAIASGGEMSTTADKIDTNTQLTSYAVNNATGSTTSTQLLQGIDSILESNDTAKSAQELMGSIEKDMATLKNRMQNLRAEATSKFKGDVPDYLVNAYINNKSQEIQNQLSILEDRYNAAYNRYKTEVGNAQWEKEYQLKKDQLQLEKDEFEYKKTLEEQGISTTSTSTSKGTGEAKMRTERNNNPTAMTTDMAKMLGGELGVDYEIGDPFVTASGQTLYTAKLIGDPIETTIRLIDRGIANGIDPFYRANGQGRWSYISSIGITKDKWLKMSPSEKAGVVAKMLQHEGGNMDNMLYYVENASKTDSSSSQGWTETDYANFETYLDPKTNQTTAKTIAMKYGFGDDYLGMTNFAREQLDNRGNNQTDSSTESSSSKGETTVNENGRVVTKDKDGKTVTYAYGVEADDPRLNEEGFDPVLGYNVDRINLYNRINSDTSVGNTARKNATEKEKQEAEAYAAAQRKGEDIYSDSNRKVTREYGFAVGKADVYNRLDAALNKGTLTTNQWNDFLSQLGFNPTNSSERSRAISEAVDELNNFKKYSNDAMNEYYKVLDALEYIIMQDANYAQRQYIMSKKKDNGDIDESKLWGEAADWASKYNLLRASEVFDQLGKAKQGGISLYPVSDADMKMVKAASTTIDGTLTQGNFRKQIENKYKTIRELVGKPITDEQIKQMWDTEGNPNSILYPMYLGPTGLLFGGFEKTPDFSNYLVYDSARYSGLLGGWDYGIKRDSDNYKGISGNQNSSTISSSDKQAVDDLIGGIQPKGKSFGTLKNN